MRAPACVGIAVACILLASCDDAAKGETAADAGARTEDETADLLMGEIVPTNATDLYPPFVSFSIPGWGGGALGNVKITELVDDGTAVEEGDLVARFDPVWLQRASLDMEEARKKAEAAAAQSAVALATELADVQARAAQKEVEAARAVRELEKKTVVSENQYKLSVIDSEIATFEAGAAARQVEAVTDKMRTERGYHSANVEARRYYEQRIAKIAARFETRAPHKGVVRHLFLPREKRKVQKGDSPSSTLPFVAVARDEKLSVRFYIPERSLGDFAVGAHVLAVSRFADKPFPGVVRMLSSFPQELGLAKHNNDLPNAREIVYVAIADLEPQPAGLSAGLEVEVRRP